MQPSIFLQTTGGPRGIVILVLLGLVVTALLSLVVAYVIARGYRNNRDPARLYLALGLILLTTGPIMVQLVLTNLTDVSALSRSAGANTSKLLGLGAILYAIYGTSDRRSPRTEENSSESNRVNHD